MQLSTLSLGLTSSGEELCANCRLYNIHSTTTESHRRDTGHLLLYMADTE